MTAFDDALKSGNPRIGIFFRLMVDEPIRLWLGVGDIEADFDATDGDGEVYSGIGTLIGMPAFTQLVNGAAERVDLRLSGVDRRAIQLAASESDDVKGRAIYIGVGVFGAEWNLLGTVWIRRLTVDFLTVEMQPDGDGITHTISLSARSFLTGRRRPQLSFLTDAEQQGRYSGDRFCERTALYSTEVSKTWPRF